MTVLVSDSVTFPPPTGDMPVGVSDLAILRFAIQGKIAVDVVFTFETLVRGRGRDRRQDAVIRVKLHETVTMSQRGVRKPAPSAE